MESDKELVRESTWLTLWVSGWSRESYFAYVIAFDVIGSYLEANVAEETHAEGNEGEKEGQCEFESLKFVKILNNLIPESTSSQATSQKASSLNHLLSRSLPRFFQSKHFNQTGKGNGRQCSREHWAVWKLLGRSYKPIKRTKQRATLEYNFQLPSAWCGDDKEHFEE